MKTNRAAPGPMALLALAVLAWPIAARAQTGFPDVPVGHPAAAAIRNLVKRNIIHGYPEGVFSGGRAMTRREFALALWRAVMSVEQMLAKLPPAGTSALPLTARQSAGLFADVPTGTPLGKLLRDLGGRGIIQGYPDQTFAASRPATQGECRAALQRTLQWVDRELAAAHSTPAGVPLR